LVNGFFGLPARRPSCRDRRPRRGRLSLSCQGHVSQRICPGDDEPVAERLDREHRRSLVELHQALLRPRRELL